MAAKYDEINEDFGKAVKALRVEENYSQEEFALQAGIDRSYYGRIERGEANPTLRNIAAIAEVLRVPIADLFDYVSKAVRRKGSAEKK
jgi:transcriptional regulator with XRE-family HTH domain